MAQKMVNRITIEFANMKSAFEVFQCLIVREKAYKRMKVSFNTMLMTSYLFHRVSTHLRSRFSLRLTPECLMSNLINYQTVFSNLQLVIVQKKTKWYTQRHKSLS